MLIDLPGCSPRRHIAQPKDRIKKGKRLGKRRNVTRGVCSQCRVWFAGNPETVAADICCNALLGMHIILWL